MLETKRSSFFHCRCRKCKGGIHSVSDGNTNKTRMLARCIVSRLQLHPQHQKGIQNIIKHPEMQKKFRKKVVVRFFVLFLFVYFFLFFLFLI